MSEVDPALGVTVVPTGFEKQKRAFFSKLAVQEIVALRAHREEGLWQREKGVRAWGNATEHCLVEAARAQVFSKLLGFEPDLASDLVAAAAVHDFYKKSEKELMENCGLSYSSYSKAQQLAAQELIAAGFRDRVVALAGAIGHSTLPKAEELLAKAELTADETAWLVMHYIDSYTIEADWAQAAEETDGKKLNDLDRRMDKAENNPRYKLINEEGKAHFDGEAPYTVQRRVGHQIEERLAQIIANKAGLEVEPLELPTFIDSLLSQKIISSA